MRYVNDFINFEQENDLFTKSIRGFKYWHIIRFQVYRKLINHKETIGEAHDSFSSANYLNRVFLKLKQIPNFIFKSPFLNFEQKDILVLNHERRVKNGKHYECLYTDYLLEKTEASYLVLEEPFLEKHYSPIKTKNIRYLDYINFKSVLFREIASKIFKYSFTQSEVRELEYILNLLNERFNICIELNDFITLVKDAYLSYRYRVSYFDRLLNRVKPKVLLIVVSYRLNAFVLTELAKRKGIKVIELQHGTMGKYHIAYNFSKKLNIDTFPDYLFTFSDYWKNNTRLPIEESKVKVVGWPYYENKRNFYNSRSKDDKKINILFLSQGIIGESLSKMALELSKIIDVNQYKVIYKLHPGEYRGWRKKYPWLVSNSIQVIDNSIEDLHYYLSKAHIQVGVSSTAIFEGLGYGLKTIICKYPSYEYMEDLFENNLVQLINNPDELLIAIMSESSHVQRGDGDFYWKKDSKRLIEQKLQEILTNSKGAKQ